MLRFLIGRIALTIPVMAVVSFVVFSLLYLTPGDPAEVIAGEFASASDIAALRQQLAGRTADATPGAGHDGDPTSQLLHAHTPLTTAVRHLGTAVPACCTACRPVWLSPSEQRRFGGGTGVVVTAACAGTGGGSSRRWRTGRRGFHDDVPLEDVVIVRATLE